jgi:hypothetical protein
MGQEILPFFGTGTGEMISPHLDEKWKKCFISWPAREMHKMWHSQRDRRTKSCPKHNISSQVKKHKKMVHTALKVLMRNRIDRNTVSITVSNKARL